MRFASFVVACVVLGLPTAGAANDYTIGDITITDPVAKPTAATAMAGAGYFTITNNGDSADILTGVTADFPRVMLHDTVMDGDVAKMEHLMGVEIAPSETLTFAPGGKHVMFMGLNGDPFEIGEQVPATMTFKNAGSVDIVFQVKEIAVDGDQTGH